jgi:hypothetical protein
MYRQSLTKQMIKISDKILVNEMIKLFGVRLTRDKILEKITLLSLPDAPKYVSAFLSITRYAEWLTYISDNYKIETKEG